MELRFYGLQSGDVVKARLNEAPEVRDNTHRTTGDDVLLNQPSAHSAFGGEKKPVAAAAVPALRQRPHRGTAGPGRRQDQRRAQPTNMALDLRTQLYREPDDAAWIEIWGITEDLLAMFRGEVASRNARFILATLSTDIQVHPDRSIRETFQRQVGTDSLFHADQRLREVAARQGIEIITLAPAMQRIAEETGAFLHGFGNDAFGHWDEDGHRVAGSLLAKQLCAGAAPPPQRPRGVSGPHPIRLVSRGKGDSGSVEDRLSAALLQQIEVRRVSTVN